MKPSALRTLNLLHRSVRAAVKKEEVLKLRASVVLMPVIAKLSLSLPTSMNAA